MSHDDQTSYAFDLLCEARYHIEGAVHVLPALREKVERSLEHDRDLAQDYYLQLERERGKLTDALESSRLALLELEIEDIARYTVGLISAVAAYNLMTRDYAKLLATLGQYLAWLPASGSAVNATAVGRMMNSIRMGYYPTDLEHIRRITKSIIFPDGITTNLFDPCCGCGLALRKMAEGNNCFTYGIELDEARAEEAQERSHRVGVGSFFYSRVSNEAFHVMLLNPPYMSVLAKDDKRVRHEKKFLAESFHHIMMGGLLVYIIPYYRLTADIARVLCDNFSNLTVWRFLDDEFAKFKQIAIMGIRQKRIDGGEHIPKLLEQTVWPEAIPSIAGLPQGRYVLPAEAKRVELFKGAVFNERELAEQLRTSNSLTNLCKKSPLESRERRPLLPLNIGQVGLIGGSGLINGLVDCETPHVIKGRIVKQAHKWETDMENTDGQVIGVERHTTISNKMIFNILTQDGIKTLA